MSGQAQAPARAGSGPGPGQGRIGRAESRRLLAGRPVHSAQNLGLQELLTAAAAPPPAPADRNCSGPELAAVLAAFAEAPAAGRIRGSRHRSAAGGRWSRQWWSRAFVVKCAAAVLLLSGAGMAAAAADVLPGPVQDIAHNVFGDLGVPAPQVTAGPTTSASPRPGHSATPQQQPGPSLQPGASSSPAAPTPTATGATPTQLCQAAAKRDATPAQLAELVADAGGANKVIPYCAHLLGGLGHSKSGTTPTTGTSEPAHPSATPTYATWGKTGEPTPTQSPKKYKR